jgi:probable HAF family extracellular repeat protein
MRKLAFLSVAFALVAVSFYGCDEKSLTEPDARGASTGSDLASGESRAAMSFASYPVTTSSTGVPIVVLGDPNWYYSRGGGINQRGDVVGTCEISLYEPCKWTAKGLIMLDGDGSESEAYGVNNRGQIIGYTTPDNIQAVLWWRGQTTLLGTLGSEWSIAYDVNDRGQIVGASGNQAGHTHAFLWEGGKMVDLGTMDGDEESYAGGINNRGQVVGYSYTRNVSHHALMWYKGQMVDLGSPPSGDYWSPREINNRGQIVGIGSDRTTREQRALLWEDGAFTDLGSLGGSRSWGNDVSEQGQVVGSSYTAQEDKHAFLWEDGNLTDLGTLGGDRSYATEINSLGQISGAAADGSGKMLAVVWLPKTG